MQRRLLGGLLVVAFLGILGLLRIRQTAKLGLPAVQQSPYRGSDAALLAATGRPQLVEFFHHA